MLGKSGWGPPWVGTYVGRGPPRAAAAGAPGVAGLTGGAGAPVGWAAPDVGVAGSCGPQASKASAVAATAPLVAMRMNPRRLNVLSTCGSSPDQTMVRPPFAGFQG